MQPLPSDAGDGESGGDGVVKRACDQCRTRKIRCDKESPCSNCRIAQRSCSSTGLGQRPKEPRQRVLISTQYEKKIDYFGARLAAIENHLRELTLSLSKDSPATGISSAVDLRVTQPHPSEGPHGSSGSTSRTFTPSSGTANTHYDDDDADDSSDLGGDAYEGNSSLTAHTVQASEFLEHAVERERWTNQQLSPNMRAALSSLQQIVGLRQQKKKGRIGSLSRREVKFPNQKPIPPGGIKDLPMPPAQTVISILRDIKETPPMTFALICAFIATEDFTESCRRVYFATEDFSLATFIVVNAGLYYLFLEKYIMIEEKNKVGLASEYLAYHHLCRDNLETGLANLSLFLPPKMETIEALLLGAGYAVEVSKPSLAWQLNSAACHICTGLGYHRLSAFQTPSVPTVSESASQPKQSLDPLSEKKQALFWFAYMLDKGLALRFGRASVLQDYDIALPKSMPSTNNVVGTFPGPSSAPDPWKEILELWIRHAEIQGKTYEHLYSTAALGRSAEARVDSARELVDQLGKISARTATLTVDILNLQTHAGNQSRRAEEDISLQTLSMVLKSDEVTHYSTMALIYHAIPASEPDRPSRFNDECIAAARAAFTSHLACMEHTASSQFLVSAYLHWTILYAPFVPFIVLFTHVIQASDKDDLRRLEEFVTSLQGSRTLSKAIDKLHRLCRIMCDVATLYVEAKEAEKQTTDMDMAPVGNDFNMYLSQLGFLPPPPQSGLDPNAMATGELDSEMLNASYQAAQLGDWFEGGRYMMGLLEEDLSQFQPEPGVWSVYSGRS